MHHSDRDWQLRGLSFPVQRTDPTEDDCHVLNRPVEGLLSDGQMQISAQADPLHRLPGKCPADVQPVLRRVLFRMATR